MGEKKKGKSLLVLMKYYILMHPKTKLRSRKFHQRKENTEKETIRERVTVKKSNQHQVVNLMTLKIVMINKKQLKRRKTKRLMRKKLSNKNITKKKLEGI